MLFPSICDVIRNLSGMWQLMFKDKYVRYFDVPQNYARDIGGSYYVNELRHLLNDLEKLSGKQIRLMICGDQSKSTTKTERRFKNSTAIVQNIPGKPPARMSTSLSVPVWSSQWRIIQN